MGRICGFGGCEAAIFCVNFPFFACLERARRAGEERTRLEVPICIRYRTVQGGGKLRGNGRRSGDVGGETLDTLPTLCCTEDVIGVLSRATGYYFRLERDCFPLYLTLAIRHGTLVARLCLPFAVVDAPVLASCPLVLADEYVCPLPSKTATGVCRGYPMPRQVSRDRDTFGDAR